jgi:hypothetical protein
MPARITSTHHFTESALSFRDHARILDGVTAVSAGEINKVSAAGLRAVKLSDESGAILLTVRGGSTIQDVRVYVKHDKRHDVKLALARFARNSDYKLRFK